VISVSLRTHSLRSNKRSSTSALSLTSPTSVTSTSVTTSKRTSTTTTARNNENEDKKTTNIQKNWKRKNQSLGKLIEMFLKLNLI